MPLDGNPNSNIKTASKPTKKRKFKTKSYNLAAIDMAARMRGM